ncbi:MAG: DUF1553 domain-containing protein [Planctomycetaceae bacterium]|nr:DUF1553 domain-containing protein [Planctomycetaceae bacterium]
MKQALRLLFVFAAGIHGSEVRADDAGPELFEKRIRPVLVEHCYGCHSQNAKEVKGGLLLDTRDGIRQGGDSGPAVVPGHPEDSLLLQAIRYDTFEMPPRQQLSAQVVRDFEQWIESGAADPRDGPANGPKRHVVDVAAGRSHWAYQVPRGHLPPVDPTGWASTPIDQFTARGLREAGLQPGPPADPGTLLRRWSYDLTGLPPTKKQMDAFIADHSPEAAERVVDELLASQQFGEHWGRHWLDVARYADSNGGDINLTFHNAWRYRNYVIDAWNSDKPFDQFVREQIAGDLMPADTVEQQAEQIVAAGFLVVGPKMLSERDKEKLQMDVVDEQLDTIGRTFLGLGLGCVRCHDHKFDPIPVQDYYALAGILRSTVTVEGIRMNNVNVSGWNEMPLPMPSEMVAAREQFEAREKALQEEIKQKKSALDALTSDARSNPANLLGIVIDDTSATLVGEWKKSSLSKSFVGAGYIHDDKADKGQRRVIFPVRVPVTGEYEVRISYTANDGRDSRVPVFVQHVAGKQKILVDQSRKPRLGGLFEPVGRFHFDADREASVTIGNEGTTKHVIADAVQIIPVAELSENANVIARSGPPSGSDPAAVMELKDALREIESLLKSLQENAPPPLARAMAVTEREQVEDCRICIRGEPHNPGPTVPRGFIQVASHPDHEPPVIQGSGRLELAEWLVSPQNPLTARVTVNRIWAHLFGHGLVRTLDDFGTLGDRPSHPELLDSLAFDFMADHWSVKRLIRRIVLSKTYAVSSAYNDAAWKTDPDNRLLWRHDRRRLTAEELRDSLLKVAGNLDPAPGQSPVEGMGESAVANNSGEDTGKKLEAQSMRRTVYEAVIRNDLPDFLTLFDFADPDVCTAQRNQTIVPAQALWLMNSAFIRSQAASIARSIVGDPELSDDEARIHRATELILGRPATDEEVRNGLAFVSGFAGREQDSESTMVDAWSQFCHALLASAEFRFVD